MKLKLHLLLFYPSIWYICDFFLFHIEIEGKGGWIIGGRGGGGEGYVGSLSYYWGAAPPVPPPSSYAYAVATNTKASFYKRPPTRNTPLMRLRCHVPGLPRGIATATRCLSPELRWRNPSVCIPILVTALGEFEYTY